MTKYEPYTRHECPHCQTTVSFDDVKKTQHTNESGGRSYNLSRFGEKGQILDVVVVQCPSCLKLVVSADKGEGQKNEPSEEYVIWPILSTRSPAPQEEPEHVADDYTEASLVLGISPKASAALSRRCLQIVLVEKGGANKKKNLSEQIVEVLPNLPVILLVILTPYVMSEISLHINRNQSILVRYWMLNQVKPNGILRFLRTCLISTM